MYNMNLHLIMNIVFISTLLSLYHFNNIRIEKIMTRNRYLEEYKSNIVQTFKVLEIELNSIKKKIKID